MRDTAEFGPTLILREFGLPSWECRPPHFMGRWKHKVRERIPTLQSRVIMFAVHGREGDVFMHAFGVMIYTLSAW